MEKIQERLELARKALNKLHELAPKTELNDVERIRAYDHLLQNWLENLQ